MITEESPKGTESSFWLFFRDLQRNKIEYLPAGIFSNVLQLYDLYVSQFCSILKLSITILCDIFLRMLVEDPLIEHVVEKGC